MTISVKIDVKGVKAGFDKFTAAYARELGPALEEIADGIIASIRKRQLWPNEKKGVLKQGLWKEAHVSGSGAYVNMGWSGRGAAFGPGHEWGFKKKKWSVMPVNIRTRKVSGNSKYVASGQRMGKPIKALRFVMGGRVMYSRGHEVSAPKKLVPHFAPAFKAYPVSARLGRAVDHAMDRAGL